MINRDQATKLRKLINTYTQATVNDSWKGAGPPNERELIAAELRAAKAELNAFIANLTKQ